MCPLFYGMNCCFHTKVDFVIGSLYQNYIVWDYKWMNHIPRSITIQIFPVFGITLNHVYLWPHYIEESDHRNQFNKKVCYIYSNTVCSWISMMRDWVKYILYINIKEPIVRYWFPYNIIFLVIHTYKRYKKISSTTIILNNPYHLVLGKKESYHTQYNHYYNRNIVPLICLEVYYNIDIHFWLYQV